MLESKIDEWIKARGRDGTYRKNQQKYTQNGYADMADVDIMFKVN
jgi:hypothetical protein